MVKNACLYNVHLQINMRSVFYIALQIIKSKQSRQNISTPAINIGAIAVGLGIAIMILSVVVMKGFKHQIISKVKNLTSDAVIIPYQSSKDITSNPVVVNENIRAIKNINEIQHTEPVCIKNGILKIKEENEGVVIKGISAKYNWDRLKPYLTEGEFPKYTDTAIDKRVIISKKLADKMQVNLQQKIIIYFVIKTIDEKTGDEKLDYRSRDFYVSGIIHPQMGELDSRLIYADARIIQKLNNWKENEYSQIEVYAKKNVSSDELIKQLIEILPYNYQVKTAEELYSNIFNWLEMIDINVVVIIVLMLIVAVVNMVSALIILILEKVSLIGILKALGMNDWNIKNIFFFISLKILAKGLIFGNLIALIIIFIQRQYHIFTLDSEVYYVNYIPMDWDIKDWLLLNMGSILSCLLFMFIPTFLITKMSPAQILRWE